MEIINYIKVNTESREMFPDRKILGVQGENEVEKLVFKLDKFFGGEARLETRQNDTLKYLVMETNTEKEEYSIVLTNELLKDYLSIDLQIRIINENGEVFKSKFEPFEVLEGINATQEIVESQPEWVDEVDTRLDKAEADIEELKQNGTGGGTTDYEDLENKPSINNIELNGNKTLDELGISQVGQNYLENNEVKGEIFNDYENNIASNVYSHAEGKGCTASGENSHAQNRRAKATGKHSHAQNYDTLAQGESSTAMGVQTKAYNKASVAEGNMCEAGDSSIASDTFNPAHAEGHQTKAKGFASHTEGQFNKAEGEASHSEGSSTLAEADFSHTEGIGAETYDKASHAEGAGTIAGRKPKNTGGTEGGGTEGIDGIWASHAEGIETKAIGQASHSEGAKTQSVGNSTHAEGTNTLAYGEASHTEGGWTQTGELDETGEHRGNTGNYAHAEGFDTRAIGQYSHSEGKGTVAKGECQHVQGRYNVIDTINYYAFIIGNGTGPETSKRKNIFSVDWTGAGIFNGSLRVKNGQYVATENYVQQYITALEKRIKALEDTIKNV